MRAATSGVYRVGRPRPRRAFGFGLAFRFPVLFMLDDVVIAKDIYHISRVRPEGPHTAIRALAVLRVGICNSRVAGKRARLAKPYARTCRKGFEQPDRLELRGAPIPLDIP